MKFSVNTQAFYGDDIDYGSSLPCDVVSITPEQYHAFYSGINENRHIYLLDGKLILSDIKPDSYHFWDNEQNRWIISDEAAAQKNMDVITAAEQKKTALLSEAQASISIWQTKLLMGRISDNEKARLNIWLDYIDAVQAVDTSTAPDIIWPEYPVV